MKLKNTFPLIVAAALQVMPMIRSALPQLQAIAPSSWAVVLKLSAGAVAYFGYHAISSASSIAISPANATVGQAYTGTITYSGGHAGSVSSMTITNSAGTATCMCSAQILLPGSTTAYSSVTTASVSGTPTTSGTFAFTIRMWDGSCSSGLNDSRSTSLVVSPPPNTNVAPSIVAPPQSVTAQVGSDALFSAGATGTPTPKYFWYLGLPSPSTQIGTNSSLIITNAQYTKAGLYTVTASNSVGTASATAYLSVCTTAGTNSLVFGYTNYVPVSNAVIMTSFLTNSSTASNIYKWQYNFVDVTTYATNGNNLSLAAGQVTAAKSGDYAVVFKSTVASTVVVKDEAYDSYWSFGAAPVVSASPQGTNVVAGATITLPVTATVQQTPSWYGTNLILGFQWYLNGTNLVSAKISPGTNQTTSLSLTNVAVTNSGTYTVVVTNFWGSITSSPAIVNVTPATTPPGFSAQPAAKSVLQGQNASFSVTATGTAPLGYQWQRNGTTLSNDAVVSGVNTNLLILTGVTAGNAGSYSVVVTNVAGTNTSSSALLTVASLPRLGITALGTNGFQFNANTLTGLSYVVQSTTNWTGWNPIYTNVVQTNGQITFTNTQQKALFFRVLFP